jgi:hypothetical protein
MILFNCSVEIHVSIVIRFVVIKRERGWMDGFIHVMKLTLVTNGWMQREGKNKKLEFGTTLCSNSRPASRVFWRAERRFKKCQIELQMRLLWGLLL